MTAVSFHKGGARLSLEGDLTLRTIAAARENLIAAFEQASEVTLHMGALGDSDLTLIQLIESARRTAAHEGKRLMLAEPASGDLRTMLERGGFVAQAAVEDRTFWLREGTK